ncbi:MAG: glycoside hydrolase family 15 protein [Pseudomonadota bacterium]
MAYQPIENYGLIGDMHTCALVAIDGSIDWMCLPRFDSPSMFCAILDDAKGGSFRVAPIHEDDITYKQFYWPATNVLVTRFLSKEGASELVDFMVVDKSRKIRRTLIRRITSLRGNIQIRAECRPAFNFARDSHETKIVDGGAEFHSKSMHVGLATKMPLSTDGDGVTANFTLAPGESANFLLHELAEGESCTAHLSEDAAEVAFRDTVRFWRNWVSQSKYRGRWREMVDRSALALKLLTYEPTGAIVAAPTCSLPEGIGGERNWDYRYTWIRDSAFTVYAFLRLGFTEEAKRFFEFISEGATHEDGTLQVMYGIDGRQKLTEEELHHLEGYMGSRPVRVGNGAYNQLQLDIYGELLDAVYLFNRYGQPIGYDPWRRVCHLVDWVCDNWQRKDEGIWEVRGGAQHFLYSKMMCWVAVDRALKVAEARSFPGNRDRWLKVRDQIYREIMEKGWNEKRQAFVQHFDSDALDAANLMMVLALFVSPIDPRMLKTLDAMMLPPEQGGLVANNLVYRYNVEHTADGLSGQEGTFNICTFWLVEALTRAGRFDPERLEDGRLIFERMLGFANHLGLFAEETSATGAALGNFPQAFTHLALISAAVNLDRALGDAP